MEWVDKPGNEKQRELFTNEVECLQQLTHPNILRLYEYNDKGVAKNDRRKKMFWSYLALEYAPNKEIFDYVAETGEFSENDARFFFHQLVDALEYIHGKGYSHRDVKPENLLLDKDFNLKLANFGNATKQNWGELEESKWPQNILQKLATAQNS